MASIVINGGTQFPEGTSVGAYPRTAWGVESLSGAPSGSATATATVTSGQIAFSGLADGTDYVAYAQVSGVDKFRRFSTRTTASTEPVVALTINSRDAAGNPTSVTEGGVTTTYTWNADGTPATETRGGITRTFTYSAGVLTGATT